MSTCSEVIQKCAYIEDVIELALLARRRPGYLGSELGTESFDMASFTIVVKRDLRGGGECENREKTGVLGGELEGT